MNSSFFLSIVIPVYNEEDNVEPLLQKIIPFIKNYDYEIIFVDDGSTDHTANHVKIHSRQNKRIKLISFNRNFGHQHALTCGYLFARGDAVITIDADLQDPPSIIPSMIEKWENGAKIVYAKRSKRDADGLVKRITAQTFYRFINFLSDVPIPDDVGDFRLLDKEVVTFINELPERARFLRGLVAWGGFKSDYVLFQREKRHAGTTHYPFSKMMNFALDGIISFSVKPLRIASYIGFFSAGIGFLGILYGIIGKIVLPRYWVTGWTALFVGIMFLGGIQLITIGIIGEYIGKIYQELQKRPQFLIKEKINL